MKYKSIYEILEEYSLDFLQESSNYQYDVASVEEKLELQAKEELEQYTYYSNSFHIDQIVEMSASKIMNFKDFHSLSSLLIRYYKEKSHLLDLNSVIAFDIKLKDFCGNSIESKKKRLFNSEILMKKLKKLQYVYAECFRNYKEKSRYVSKYQVLYINKKIIKEQEMLKNTYIRSESTGKIYNLADMTRSNSSKMSELYCINKQLSQVAESKGFTWIFPTFTCPSKFHINAQARDSWDRESNPKQSSDFISKIWRAIFKRLSQLKISDEIFGCWTKEPHVSMSVHKHALLYVNPEYLKLLKSVIVQCVKNEYEKEGAFFQAGVSVKIIEEKDSKQLAKKSKKKASPATYIFKYIMKSMLIESCVIKDNDKDKIIDIDNTDFEAIRAHYRSFSYRRFGFVGLDRCLGFWRELKRFDQLSLDTNNNKTLETLLFYVKTNNFKAFNDSELRKNVKMIYACAEYDEKGNVLSYKKDDFGDDIKIVIGFKIDSQAFVTRTSFEILNKSYAELLLSEEKNK